MPFHLLRFCAELIGLLAKAGMIASLHSCPVKLCCGPLARTCGDKMEVQRGTGMSANQLQRV